MEDISKGLLTSIQEHFERNFNKSEVISTLYKKVRDGTATYAEANDFALEVGKILAQAYKNNLSSDILPNGHMYYNIAQKIISPTMENNYDLIAQVASEVQKSLNEAANIHIKAIQPELNTDRIYGIVNKLDSVENYDDVAWVLDEPIKNFSQSIVDDFIRENVEFQAKAGMQPKVIRKLMGGCCDWCRSLAGTYVHPDVPKDVYRRHQRCRCTVEYNPGDGKVQNVHSKQWMSEEESAKIEVRKSLVAKEVKKESPKEKEERIDREYGFIAEEERKDKRIQNAKKINKKDLDAMSLEELRVLAEKLAVEYYESGLSGISFGNFDKKEAARLLAKSGTRTSLKKDILFIQKKLKKK